MADKVKFSTGLEKNLPTTKESGKVYFATNDNNEGSIYFDKDSDTRVKMTTAARGVTVNGVEKGSVNLDESSNPTLTLKSNTFVIGTGTTAGTWTGSLFGTGITELYDGLIIDYWMNTGGASGGTTLNLNLSDGSATGAKNVYFNGASRLTTHYSSGNIVRMVYRSSVIINGTSYTGWWITSQFYIDNTYIRYSLGIKANTAITSNNIIVGTDSGYNNLNSGKAFDITYPIYWAGSNIAASGIGYNNYLMYSFNFTNMQAVSSFDTTPVAYKPIYIKGTLSGNTFTPISTTPLTQTTSDTNYSYMLLGMTYSTTNMCLIQNHPIYATKNGTFGEIVNYARNTDYATGDSTTIRSKYVSGVTASGQTVTVTKGDGSTSTLTTQDKNVTQTVTSTNANYEVLFSNTADNTTRTEGARKNSNLTFNPSTGTLTTTKFSGSLSGNATTASTWETARTFRIKDTSGDNSGPGVDVNGNGEVNLYLPSTIKASITGHASEDLPLAGGTMTGNIAFADTTFSSNPTDSKGIKWTGGTDGASIFYRQTANNNGSLILLVSDDGEESIVFSHSKGGSIWLKPYYREFYPSADNTGSVGGAKFKWANMYATTFNGDLNGLAAKATSDSAGQNIASTYIKSVNVSDEYTLSTTNGVGSTTTIGNFVPLNSSKLIDLKYIPQAALERLTVVADDTARLALTTSTVQNGDVVKVTSTGKMYFVKDETKLTSEDGYEVFTAGTASAVAWGNVTGKPTLLGPNTTIALGSNNTSIVLKRYDSNGAATGTDTTISPAFLPLAGGTMTGNITFSKVNIGLYGKDAAGRTYALAKNNETNFWLGAASGTSTAHTGNTYISTGWDATNKVGYRNFRIAVPTLADDGTWSNVYYIPLDNGNYTNYVYSKSTSDGKYLGSIAKATSTGTEFSIKGVYANSKDGSSVTIPNASASVAGLITTGAQTLTGAKTIDSSGSLTINASNGFNYAGIGTGTDNAARPVWFAYSGVNGKPVYNSNFTYNPSTKTLVVENISGTASKATSDSAGNNINTTYLKDLKQVTSNGTTFTFRGIKGSESDGTLITVPAASTSVAGLVTTGGQTFAGIKTFESEIYSTSQNSFRMVYGNYGVILRNDGDSTYFLLTNSGNQEGSWNTLRPFKIKNSTGICDISGNSATATKLATARNIALDGNLQGSASFDGSANITITALNYQAIISSVNTSNYPWHRIATITVGTGTWIDRCSLIRIRHLYHGGGEGLAKIAARTNASGAACGLSIVWLYRHNIAEDALQGGLYGTTGDNVVADIYYKCSTYARAIVENVSNGRVWTLVTSSEVSNTTSSDKLTSYEVYTSVADGGSTIRGVTYTITTTASDNIPLGISSASSGTTNTLAYYSASNTISSYTSSKGSGTKLWYLNAGVPTESSSTVGSTTTPVYLNSGTITTCTGRTVPGIKSATNVTTLGWGTNNSYVPDISQIAYWNGAYSGTSSNLCYLGVIRNTALNLTPLSGEGGEIHLNASTANTAQAGIILDQYNSTFRICGTGSADGTTITGVGTPLVIDPYNKSITGGYTITGTLSGNASTATLWQNVGANCSTAKSTWNNSRGGTIVYGQSWKSTAYTYTPSGGSATTITDSGDVSFYVKAGSTTSNVLTANMAIDGEIFAGTQVVSPIVNATSYFSSPYLIATSAMSLSAGKVSGLATATSRLHSNGLVISNPATANDQGWIRVTGTSESDTVLEIATGDDGGAGEQIVARQYNTSNAVAHQITLLDTSGYTTLNHLNVGYTNTSYDISTGSLISNSWIRTKGSTGWYSEDYGGGWYMSDTSWIRTYGNKSIYQNTGTLRTDGTLQVGSSGTYFQANSSGVTSSTNFTLNRTSTQGGYYLQNSGTTYARAWVSTIGTAGDGTNAGTTGYVYLQLGNDTSVTSTSGSGANNATGRIRLYGSGSYYQDIIPQPNGSNRSVYLPNYAGTMYLIHGSSNSAIGSSTKPVYIAANGRATACTYSLSSTVNSGTTSHLAYYSASGAISSASNMSIDNDENRLTVTSASGDYSEFTATRTGGSTVWMGVGSGNTNHGLYSDTLNKWMVYADTSNVYLKGNADTATTLSSTLAVNLGGTGKTSWTANRLIYSSAATTLANATMYCDGTHLGVNSTTTTIDLTSAGAGTPTHTLYVGGSGYFSSFINISGNIAFVGSNRRINTTYDGSTYNVLRMDHGSGNVSLNAASGNLYLGWTTTNAIILGNTSTDGNSANFWGTALPSTTTKGAIFFKI